MSLHILLGLLVRKLVSIMTPTESMLPSLVGCLIMSGSFIGSLYVWSSKYNRDHPTTIKQRFCSVFVVVILSPVILKLFVTSKELQKFSVFELTGLRLTGFFPAAVLPLILTMVLFLGPLCMINYRKINFRFWIYNFTDLIWLRNVVVGPLFEEITFRACMMPLLMQCFETLAAIFVCSLFFGLAHIHHVIERYRAGDSCKILIVRALIQFSYTTLFGGYSAFLFVKTGHFVSPLVVHAFCNVMELPDFGKILTYENPKKIMLVCLFVLGLVLWYILLKPMTDCRLYNNYIYYDNPIVHGG